MAAAECPGLAGIQAGASSQAQRLLTLIRHFARPNSLTGIANLFLSFEMLG
jgi:hypothetical protein